MYLQRQSSKRAVALLVAAVAMAGISQWGRADAISDAINAASAKLVSLQVVPANPSTSAWEGSYYTGFNGNIIAGLTSAYQANGVQANITAAKNGADALIANVNYLGVNYAANEIYGLTRVSDLQVNPNSNPYHDAAYNFFATNPVGSNVNTVVAHLESGYSAMLAGSGYSTLDKTLTTVSLAQYTVAAYAVGAPNQAAYRSALIAELGLVADGDSAGSTAPQYCPTQALGAAVWALAKTGNGLDATVITGPTGLTDPLQNAFGGKTLAQLPAILEGRLDPTTHTFFTFLTTSGFYAYTEDTAFGILGLDAADFAGHTSTYAADLAAARLALSASVDPVTGETIDNSAPGWGYYTGGEYAGMALQALSASPVPEPASLSVLALGALGLLTRRRKARI